VLLGGLPSIHGVTRTLPAQMLDRDARRGPRLLSIHGATRTLPAAQMLGPPMGRDARRGPRFLRHRLPRSLLLGPAMLPKKTHRLSLMRAQVRPAEAVSTERRGLLLHSFSFSSPFAGGGVGFRGAAGAAVSGGGSHRPRTRRTSGGRPGRSRASFLPPPSHCPCALHS